jgi:outer membrane biogenesis lipoprotein LolB
MMNHRFLAIFLVLTLFGCAPPKPQDPDHWTIHGKVTAMHSGHTQHLRFVWQHEHDHDHLTLMDHLGLESINIDRDDAQGWHSKDTRFSPENLAHHFGFHLPFSVLHYWIIGDKTHHPLPPWEVSYPSDTNDHGIKKPRDICLTAPEYRVIIHILKWS